MGIVGISLASDIQRKDNRLNYYIILFIINPENYPNSPYFRSPL